MYAVTRPKKWKNAVLVVVMILSKWVWVHENEEEITNHFGNQYSVKRMDWDTTQKSLPSIDYRSV